LESYEIALPQGFMAWMMVVGNEDRQDRLPAAVGVICASDLNEAETRVVSPQEQQEINNVVSQFTTQVTNIDQVINIINNNVTTPAAPAPPQNDTGGLTEQPLTVEIIPNATQGIVPTYFGFEAKVTGGTAPYTYSWGWSGNHVEPYPYEALALLIDRAVTMNVFLTVTDSKNQTASDSVQVTVREPGGVAPPPPPPTNDTGDGGTPPPGGGGGGLPGPRVPGGGAGVIPENATAEADRTPPVVNVPPHLQLETNILQNAQGIYGVDACDNVDGAAALTIDNILIQDSESDVEQFCRLPPTQDGVGGDITISCNPPSGSMFVVGVTTVQCTAVDASGNTGTASFNIRVNRPPIESPFLAQEQEQLPQVPEEEEDTTTPPVEEQQPPAPTEEPAAPPVEEEPATEEEEAATTPPANEGGG